MTNKLRSNKKLKMIIRNYDLYLILLPTLIFFIIFCYLPMYGVIIAFKNYIPALGFEGSEWVGFAHFIKFFNSYKIWSLISNTLLLNIYGLAIGFPIPIIMALLLNQINSDRFKKIVQTVTYAPYFISVVVIVGMIYIFLSPRNGILNIALGSFGIEPIFFMGEAKYFRSIYIWSGIWQSAGFSMIIYLSALSGIDTQLYDAAKVDGCSKLGMILHIDLPLIMPTISILFILAIGQLMNVGFEKIYLLQNSLNQETSDVIATYVYKMGLKNGKLSYSTAIGLFNSVVNCSMLFIFNYIVKKLSNDNKGLY